MAKEKNYLDINKKVLNIDKAILFGSYLNGIPHQYSDIDLMVLSKDLDPNIPKLQHLREIKDKANLFDPDLQLFLYPTEVFEKELCVEQSFIKEIKRTGKVVYP